MAGVPACAYESGLQKRVSIAASSNYKTKPFPSWHSVGGLLSETASQHSAAATQGSRHTVQPPHGAAATRCSRHTVQPSHTQCSRHTVQPPHSAAATQCSRHTVQPPHSAAVTQCIFQTAVVSVF